MSFSFFKADKLSSGIISEIRIEINFFLSSLIILLALANNLSALLVISNNSLYFC